MIKKRRMHIGKIILKSLKEKDRNIAWFARKINCNDANLGRLLKNSQYIHSELLVRISIALEEDFFVHCSEVVKKKIRML